MVWIPPIKNPGYAYDPHHPLFQIIELINVHSIKKNHKNYFPPDPMEQWTQIPLRAELWLSALS